MNFRKIKKKEKKEKMPIVRHFSQKKANKIILSVFIIFLSLSAIGAVRSNVVAANFNRLDDELQELHSAFNQQSSVEEKAEYDSSLLFFYARNFVKEYINVDTKATDEDKNARLERLSEYLSFDVEDLDQSNQNPKELKREFKSAEVVSVEETSDCLLVRLNVIYVTDQEKVRKQFSQDIVLPIQVENNLFSIVGRPYILGTKLPQGKTTELTQSTNKKEISAEEMQAIGNFLNMFFQKYSTANREEMKLLMRTPELLTGMYDFVSLDESNINYFETKQEGVYGVQVSATFKDKETILTHTEDFTIWLTETENSYFVNTLVHYFTEEEGK